MHFVKNKISINIKRKISNPSDYFSWRDGVCLIVWGFLGIQRCSF
jgi:hypothetical protein